MSKREDTSYLGKMVSVAPAFGAKALIGDLPKGSLEHAVQAKTYNPKTSFPKSLKAGFKGRGLGRAIGGVAGIATAPLFLKGLSMAGSKNAGDRKKGIALLAGIGGVYAGQKGFFEGYQSAKGMSLPKAEAISRGMRLGTIRAGYKAPAAVLLGLSIVRGRASTGKEKPSIAKKLIIPALSGAAIGALSRGGEEVFMSPLKRFSSRRVLSAAVGGSAGGALGGLVLAGAVEGAMRAMKKEASGGIEKLAADPISAGIVGKALLRGLADIIGIHAVTKGALGYGKVGKRMAVMPGTRGTVRAAKRAQSRQLAIGIREGIAGRTSEGFRGTMSLNLSIPELRLQRQMGQKLGRMLRGVPESERPRALKWLQKRVQDTPELRYSRGGEPIPVLSSLPEGIDMALGHKKLYVESKHFPTFKKAWEKMMLSGRGVIDQVQGGEVRSLKGLPRAGFADPTSGGMLSRASVPDWVTMAGALSGGMALGGPVGGLLAAHGTWSGVKGLASRTKAIQGMASGEASRGIRKAIMPKWGQRPSEVAKEHLMDLVISPEARGFGKLTGALARGGIARVGRRAGSAFEKNVKKALMPRKANFADMATLPVAGGLAAASLYNIKADR